MAKKDASGKSKPPENKKFFFARLLSRDPSDMLYNRRLMAYFSLLYSAIWFQEILILIFAAAMIQAPLETATIVALLGVPTSLAGLGFWNYLEACKTEDKEKKKNEGTPEPIPPVTVAETQKR